MRALGEDWKLFKNEEMTEWVIILETRKPRHSKNKEDRIDLFSIRENRITTIARSLFGKMTKKTKPDKNQKGLSNPGRQGRDPGKEVFRYQDSGETRMGRARRSRRQY